MSKHKIRENKTCLNCGAFVENRFCSKCGQENTESRKSFHHLFIHFVSDLVHYDGSLWKTVRYLLFSPAKLTREYMGGKRKSYVDPVKLYIFISFLAFFIPAIIPSNEDEKKSLGQEIVDNLEISSKVRKELKENFGENITLARFDSIHESLPEEKRFSEKEIKYARDWIAREGKRIAKEEEDEDDSSLFNGYRSLAHFDSLQQSLPEDKRDSFVESHFTRTMIKFAEKEDKGGNQKMLELFVYYLPKALFVYMPIFAFWLWLFNSKRRFKFFDSGIFTLHFFSFLLLLITLFVITQWIIKAVGLSLIFLAILYMALFIYITYYFFKANRRYYGQRRWIANLKACILVVINSFSILFVLVGYLYFLIVRTVS